MWSGSESMSPSTLVWSDGEQEYSEFDNDVDGNDEEEWEIHVPASQETMPAASSPQKRLEEDDIEEEVRKRGFNGEITELTA